MKRALCLVMFLFGASICYADPEIPNLKGTWSTSSEGLVMLKGKEPGPKTHWTKSMTTLKGEITITRQQGRILEGMFKSARATEIHRRHRPG